MHLQRTELLFLALISIFNFLLPHFNCFVQLAFLSASPGTDEDQPHATGQAGLSWGLCSWIVSLEHPTPHRSSWHHQTPGFSKEQGAGAAPAVTLRLPPPSGTGGSPQARTPTAPECPRYRLGQHSTPTTQIINQHDIKGHSFDGIKCRVRQFRAIPN